MPLAKIQNIVTRFLADEILVYDLETHKAHNLNNSVSAVWNLCDGKTSVRSATLRMKKHLGLRVESDFIYLALNELEKANLLDDSFSPVGTTISRRKVLFKYASTAVLLPIVVSLTAPNSVNAQSCSMLQQPCVSQPDCCPGISFCQGGRCCREEDEGCIVDADCCNPTHVCDAVLGCQRP